MQSSSYDHPHPYHSAIPHSIPDEQPPAAVAFEKPSPVASVAVAVEPMEVNVAEGQLAEPDLEQLDAAAVGPEEAFADGARDVEEAFRLLDAGNE